jgi:hypothetical protein
VADIIRKQGGTTVLIFCSQTGRLTESVWGGGDLGLGGGAATPPTPKSDRLTDSVIQCCSGENFFRA